MFGIALVELLLLPFLALGAAVTLVWLVVTAVQGDAVAAGHEERAVRRVQRLGLALGVAGGAWVLVTSGGVGPGLGTDAVVAPMLLGLVVLVAVVVGEVVVRPRFGTAARVADLRPRRVRDQLPRLLTPLVAGTAAAGLALCAFTLTTASSDGLGRAGRALSASCLDGSTSTRSPYPGSFYLTPYALGVVLALAVALFAAHRITTRSLGGSPEQADRHRAVGLRSVVAALGVVVAAPLTGIAYFAGWALTSHSCVPEAFGNVGIAALLLVLLSALTTTVCLLALLVPVPYAARRPEPVRA